MDKIPPIQWDYIVDRTVRATEVGDRLITRGRQGWELVTATQDGESYSLFFKRPMPYQA